MPSNWICSATAWGSAPASAVEQFELRALLAQLLGGAAGALFQGRQFGLALVQAIADQHQLLQAFAVGVPGVAQGGEGDAVGQLPGDPLQAFAHQALFFQQLLDALLALGAGLLGAAALGLGLGQALPQALQVGLFGKGFAQQRGAGAVLFLGLGQGRAGVLQLLLQAFLLLLQGALLFDLLLDLLAQRQQAGAQLCLAQELVPLRRQLFQALQAQALRGQGLGVLFGRLQLFGGALPGFLPLA